MSRKKSRLIGAREELNQLRRSGDSNSARARELGEAMNTATRVKKVRELRDPKGMRIAVLTVTVAGISILVWLASRVLPPLLKALGEERAQAFQRILEEGSSY